MLKLPRLATEKDKYFIIVFYAIANIVFYSLTNHYTVGKADYLPLTDWELSLPVMPWTIWIYAFMYAMVLYIFARMKHIDMLNRLGYAFIFCQVICYFFFIFFPITYPRDNYPLPVESIGLTRMLFDHIRTVDMPTNCFPSLHVTNVFLMSYYYLHENKMKFAFWFSMALLIAWSTLTTKQHYLWDVVAGILLANTAYLFFTNKRFVTIVSKEERQKS